MAPADLRRSEWILLGEDTVHLNFIYHWLRARDVPAGKIRRQPVPAGTGAGEQHVRGSDDAREAASRLARLREAPADAPDSLRRFLAEIARVSR